ncbi:MAG: response regulator [Thermogutta sp.]|nr:response regulator [Thermogutta sp.]
MSKHVLSVGNCGFDNARLSQRLSAWFNVEITTAADHRTALAMVRERPFDLVLVNRVFDGSGESGLDLIAEMKQSPELAAIPVMLLSNYPEYQRQAVELGAVAGFGKQDLNGDAVKGLLSPYLAESSP